MDLISIFDAIQSDANGGALSEHHEPATSQVEEPRSGLPEDFENYPDGIRWWLSNIATAGDREQAQNSYELFERHYIQHRQFIDAAQALLRREHYNKGEVT